MSNLLEELKKSGLANAKKAKQAERELKQKQHREHKQAPESAKASLKADEAQEALDKMAEQKRKRLEALYREAEVQDSGGRRKFYYCNREGYIDCLLLSDLAVACLERGKYALVRGLDEDEALLVKQAQALAIQALDPERIVVLKK